MKVKYIDNEIYKGLTKGKIYDAKDIGDFYEFINDEGNMRSAFKWRFEVITDTPQIEVGSEWVTNGGKSVVIKYIGKTYLIYSDLKNNDEQSELISFFSAAYKPKTVTMYFHKTKTGKYFAQETKCTGYLFTKEIDL